MVTTVETEEVIEHSQNVLEMVKERKRLREIESLPELERQELELIKALKKQLQEL
jgi:hypothetical protein